jgi:hypothetical protein
MNNKKLILRVNNNYSFNERPTLAAYRLLSQVL